MTEKPARYRPDQQAQIWLDQDYAGKADRAAALLTARGTFGTKPVARVQAVRVALDELLDQLTEQASQTLPAR